MTGSPGEHTFNLLKWIMDPATISTIVTFTSIVAGGTIKVWKKLEHKQNKDIESIRNDVQSLSVSVHSTLKEVQMDNLRIQILQGLNSNSGMSIKEISDLYENYKSMGGNSYISRMVESAIEKSIKGEQDDK